MVDLVEELTMPNEGITLSGKYTGSIKNQIRHARKGPERLFGREDDVSREDLSSGDAQVRFSEVWNDMIKPTIKKSPAISHAAATVILAGITGITDFLKEVDRKHVQGRIHGVLFIAQICSNGDVDQVWFPLSSTGNPKGLWVEFENKIEKKEMVAMAHRVGKDLETWIVESLRKKLKQGKNTGR